MVAPTFSPQVSLVSIKEGFTQSELSMFDECSMKWNFKYNNLLERADTFNWALWIGQTWHNFQEKWRVSKGSFDVTKCSPPILPQNIIRDSEFEKWYEYWMMVMPAYQMAYASLYREEATDEYMLIEQELTMELLGYKIRGKIDLASSKYMFIRDFKSTVSAWLISPQGWHFKLQFMTYCWLMAKNYPVWGKTKFKFQLDMMQKPGLKQTKADATWAGHIRRVCADVKERASEYYLSRQQVEILPEQIRRFETFVLMPKITKLHLAIENPELAVAIVTNPNTNACNAYGRQCEFFELCEKGFDVGKHFFIERAVKHQELV